LADKEKELEELRSLIKDNEAINKEEDKEAALKKIEDLNQQLEVILNVHEFRETVHNIA
jgi:hypothetical protein